MIRTTLIALMLAVSALGGGIAALSHSAEAAQLRPAAAR